MCRALLAKTAGLQKMPEYIETNHVTYTKINLKTMPQNILHPSNKKKGKHFHTIIERKKNLRFMGPMLDPFGRDFAAQRVFVSRLFDRDPPGHPPRTIFDASIKQKGSKRAKHDLKRMLKLCKMNTENMPEPK